MSKESPILNNDKPEEKFLGKKTVRLSKIISENLKEKSDSDENSNSSSEDNENTIKNYNSLGRINLKKILNSNNKTGNKEKDDDDNWTTNTYKELKEYNKERNVKPNLVIGSNYKETNELLSLLPMAKNVKDKYRENPLMQIHKNKIVNKWYNSLFRVQPIT